MLLPGSWKAIPTLVGGKLCDFLVRAEGNMQRAYGVSGFGRSSMRDVIEALALQGNEERLDRIFHLHEPQT